MTDELTSEAHTRSARRWPLSNYVILLAMVLLSGAGLSFVLSTDATADRLAGFAYYLLVVGLGLRITENVFGAGLRAGFSGSFRAVSKVGSRFGSDDRTQPSAAVRGQPVIEGGTPRTISRVVLPISFVVGILSVLWWFAPRTVELGEFIVAVVLVPVLVFDYYYFSS